MTVDIFEPIFDASILEDAVIATLRKWLPTYIAEIESQRGLEIGRIPVPATYASRNQFTSFPDEQMPMVIVVSPGLSDSPVADGEGRYSGWWTVGVGVAARASTETGTNSLAKIYAAAVRAVLLQHQALDESWEFSGVEWMDETYTDIPTEERERTIRAAQCIFRVWVEDLTNKFAGPTSPAEPDPDQVGSQWPDVQTADVVVELRED